jgi:hypothetical protein
MGGDDEGAPSTAHCLHWNMVLNASEPHLGVFDEESGELEWLTYGQVVGVSCQSGTKSLLAIR